MTFADKFAAFFILIFASFAALFGGLDESDYDLVLKFESEPASGYAWVVEINDEDKVELSKQTFLAGFGTVIDGYGYDCFCFDAKESGPVTLTFSYIYKNNPEKVEKKVVYYVLSTGGNIEVLVSPAEKAA